MSREVVWKISATTSAEAEAAVAELLAHLFGLPASSYTNVETGATIVSVYRLDRSPVPPVKRAALRAGLERIKTCGLNIGPGRISARKLRRQDWAESWKRHFKPIEVGNALLVKPSWSRRRPRQNQAVVVLDPGLSFGTGQHPTTAFCLQQLVACRKPGREQSFLDIGTGSGILAIAAAKLGYAPVRAIDSDPEAVRVARANARANRVFREICITRQDAARLTFHPTRQYDVVGANLISTLLLAERRRILSWLAKNSMLILAGILESEFPKVQKNYESLGLNLVASQRGNEWRSGAFAHRQTAL
jgi:ribosomal protein L11 methyltransferase